MNNNSPQPSFELPPLPNEAGGFVDNAREKSSVGPESLNLPTSQPVQSSPVPTNAQPLMPVSPLPSQQSTSVSGTASLAADDNDLIEKEWVVKAKQIVAATKEDPFTQNREMSKFKAEYLKKRYNKDIQVEGS